MYEANIPKDPANKLAIFLNYFFPGEDDVAFWNEYYDFELISLHDNIGIEYYFLPNYKWGRDKDYKNIEIFLAMLKEY